MKKFKILSIDGVGIRGLILAKVLSELEEELKNESLRKSFVWNRKNRIQKESDHSKNTESPYTF